MALLLLTDSQDRSSNLSPLPFVLWLALPDHGPHMSISLTLNKLYDLLKPCRCLCLKCFLSKRKGSMKFRKKKNGPKLDHNNLRELFYGCLKKISILFFIIAVLSSFPQQCLRVSLFSTSLPTFIISAYLIIAVLIEMILHCTFDLHSHDDIFNVFIGHLYFV